MFYLTFDTHDSPVAIFNIDIFISYFSYSIINHSYFDFQHTVCINNVEVRTVKPGTYKHTITGLTPNTVYRVTVRAKNIKASPFVDEKSLVRLLEKLSAHTEFRTLNKGKANNIF